MPGVEHKKPTIGVVSELTGCPIETIRYYERIGLLPEPARSPGGFRLYSDDHVKRLTFIRRARALGFHLDEVRELLSLVEANAYTCAEVREITLNHLAEIERKLADLVKLQATLKEMAAQCEGDHVPVCPVIDALWEYGRESNSRDRPQS